MLKISLPNVELLFLTKPFGAGAGSSDPTMPDVLRRNRDASVIPGIWTNSSSESTARRWVESHPRGRVCMTFEDRMSYLFWAWGSELPSEFSCTESRDGNQERHGAQGARRKERYQTTGTGIV
jgi:hypothetical protein